MELFTQLERAVLELLLEGEDPVRRALRKQLAVAQVRERQLTGVGFFTSFMLPAEIVPVSIPVGLSPLGDVHAQLEGLQHGAGFLLFLKEGRLDFLEGYSYDEPWPENVVRFVLRREKALKGRAWD